MANEVSIEFGHPASNGIVSDALALQIAVRPLVALLPVAGSAKELARLGELGSEARRTATELNAACVGWSVRRLSLSVYGLVSCG